MSGQRTATAVLPRQAPEAEATPESPESPESLPAAQADDKSGSTVRWGMRHHRRQLKQTQQEVADALGVSLSTYQRWERGEQVPRLRTQRTLAKHFRVKLPVVEEWFYSEDDCPTCGLLGLYQPGQGGHAGQTSHHHGPGHRSIPGRPA